eukprot:10990477-Heterocapsa_arctica.AAC.1
MQFSSLLTWSACLSRPTHSRKSLREAELKQRGAGLPEPVVGDLGSVGAVLACLATMGSVLRLSGGRVSPGAAGAATVRLAAGLSEIRV